MVSLKKSTDGQFYASLMNSFENESELNIRKIYSMFPDINKQTIRWRLYNLVQQGKLVKEDRGYYSVKKESRYNIIGYEYLQNKSKDIYNYVSEYGYNFYISGLDALVGELWHIPEQFTVILVTEEKGMPEIYELLSDKGYLVIREGLKNIIQQDVYKNKIDVTILKGKNYGLASEGVAIKEKAFVDLYYAVTRLDYPISIPELSRIYENMKRNKVSSSFRMKQSAKERGITTEINWLLELGGVKPKALEFMQYQLKEAICTE